MPEDRFHENRSRRVGVTEHRVRTSLGEARIERQRIEIVRRLRRVQGLLWSSRGQERVRLADTARGEPWRRQGR